MSRRRLLGAPVTIERVCKDWLGYDWVGAYLTDQHGDVLWVQLSPDIVHQMYVEADTSPESTYARWFDDTWIERGALGAMRDALIQFGAYDLCPAVDGRAACERIAEDPPYCEHHRKER